MRLIPLLLLLAATPAAAAPSLEDYLSGRATPDRRVVPAASARVSLTPEGPPLGLLRPAHPYVWLEVVEMAGDRPRVRLHDGGVALAAFVDPATITTTATVLSPGPDEVGLHLRPGVPLDVVDGRAILANDELTASGAIDAAAVGMAYDIHADPGEWKLAPDATVPAGASILGAPGGQPIARLRGHADVQRLGPTRKGHALVAFVGAHGQVRVVGWLPRAKLGKHSPPRDASAFLATLTQGPAITQGIGKDTRLYDAPHGRLIGMTYELVETRPLERNDGWTSWKLTVDGIQVIVWTEPRR